MGKRMRWDRLDGNDLIDKRRGSVSMVKLYGYDERNDVRRLKGVRYVFDVSEPGWIGERSGLG